MELEDLLSLITSARITTSYRGPTSKFITDWLDYIRCYKVLVPAKSCFPSNMKKAMLQNALQGHDAFLNATQIERYSIFPSLTMTQSQMIIQMSMRMRKKMNMTLLASSSNKHTVLIQVTSFRHHQQPRRTSSGQNAMICRLCFSKPKFHTTVLFLD